MSLPHQSASAYALLFLRSVQVPVEEALRGTGLSEQDLLATDYVDTTTLATILHNIDASDIAPGWSARAGAQLNVSTHGPLGFAALSAPTLGDALRVLADYHDVRVTSLRAELEQVGQRFRFSIFDLSGDEAMGRWLCEAIIKVIESLVETVVGHPAGEHMHIEFAYPPPGYVEVLESVYAARCYFNAQRTALSIPASWQHIPSPLHDDAMYRANIAKCRSIISGLRYRDDPAARVRMALESYFDNVIAGSGEGEDIPDVAQLATTMHTTPRTLIRKLKRVQTSYKSILEEVRRERAARLLGETLLPVAEVAHRLGYRDPANFGRAFRRWHGRSPAAWRRDAAMEKGPQAR